jgi:hypothetical protein
VIEPDEVTDLVGDHRLQVVDHVLIGDGELVEGVVDLDVGVEDLAAIRVEGDRRLGQVVVDAVVVPVGVLEEDDVGVAAVLVVLGAVAAHVVELAEGQRGRLAFAVEVRPGDEAAGDDLAHLHHRQVDRPVGLQAVAHAHARPGELGAGGLAAVLVARAVAGAGGAAAEGLGVRRVQRTGGHEQGAERPRAPTGLIHRRARHGEEGGILRKNATPDPRQHGPGHAHM